MCLDSFIICCCGTTNLVWEPTNWHPNQYLLGCKTWFANQQIRTQSNKLLNSFCLQGRGQHLLPCGTKTFLVLAVVIPRENRPVLPFTALLPSLNFNKRTTQQGFTAQGGNPTLRTHPVVQTWFAKQGHHLFLPIKNVVRQLLSRKNGLRKV